MVSGSATVAGRRVTFILVAIKAMLPNRTSGNMETRHFMLSGYVVSDRAGYYGVVMIGFQGL